MRMLIKTFIISIIIFVLFTPTLYAQTNNSEPDIRHRLEMIEKGQAEAVRAELPSLMTNYQNNPGVMYLQAVLTTDGTEAAKLYQNIVDNFPKSEWGDDALYKLYQYYYSIGLYKTADQKLTQLKEEYPFSAYATEKNSDSGRKASSERKTNGDETQRNRAEICNKLHRASWCIFNASKCRRIESKIRKRRISVKHLHHRQPWQKTAQSLGR